MRKKIQPMDETNETRRSKLMRLLKERFEGNQAELARAIDRAPATVWRLVTKGQHEKPIGEKLARDIERALDLPIYWLDGVAQVMLPPAIPLLSEEAAVRVFLGDVTARGERARVVFSSNDELGRNAVALTVLGNAMEPDYQVGDRVFIDPDVSPAPGDIVAAVLNGTQLVLRKLRMLTPDGKRFELLPHNANYAPIKSDDTVIQIAGVSVEHHRSRHQATKRYAVETAF